MSERQLQTDGRGLTPVIGIILLVSITVLLAATTAAFVLGIEDDSVQETAPTVAVNFDYDADASGSDTLQVMHQTGELLEPDQTFVAVEGATCTTPDDPNGRYEAATDFGTTQRIAAGMSLDVAASLAGGTDLCAGTLALRGATVRLVWQSPNGRTSTTLETWTGPGA